MTSVALWDTLEEIYKIPVCLLAEFGKLAILYLSRIQHTIKFNISSKPAPFKIQEKVRLKWWLGSLSLGCPPRKENEVENAKHRGKHSVWAYEIGGDRHKNANRIHIFVIHLPDASNGSFPISPADRGWLHTHRGSFPNSCTKQDSTTYFAWCVKTTDWATARAILLLGGNHGHLEVCSPSLSGSGKSRTPFLLNSFKWGGFVRFNTKYAAFFNSRTFKWTPWEGASISFYLWD